ncbi:2-oxoglutarate dehydrogenase complex dihydrolipoyllysine-residue succinyltransferase [Cryomorpha ignava]|uniref:Dihydrolipoyllysine-residue succinyltransferase component of 2-oxoglutarate dehydrogenase complex n=1 Tax=Cryomorpha ignava TaxID=101383 RepID=A0A7K3WJX9_9FLAO|nr:2-oxoglutarate dehydrogenase complex dihydrolipoyllysine-residue succinyltransferase [Cryomorpha ignava]NEN21953.1 2-oxoglutarate dehydrogenase complex dihydrolipoyllysine-residue succinyltransferase [Cryomorpha ignava]
MMFEMKVPSPGESISEVEIAAWLVSDGDYVEKDQPIAEIDSDKATLELPAEVAGVVQLKAEEGETVAVGQVVCLIDTDAAKPEGKGDAKTDEKEKPEEKSEEVKSSPKADASKKESVTAEPAEKKEEKKEEPKPEKASSESKKPEEKESYAKGHPSPSAKKMMDENNVPANKVKGSGPDGRITKQDVVSAMAGGFDTSAAAGWGGTRDTEKKRMSMLRRKVAERLVGVKNETAMLTTFNEVNMKPIMDMRTKYKEAFKENHGVGLGFMSFFTKAVTEALNMFPTVNAMMDGEDMITHNYADIGIAVSSPKGLMVPVVRNAEQMSLAEIESEIKRLAIKARDGKISIDEMQGGTFTITNGGVFGSMMSTPIINPPQSAILGMHNIVDRPMAVNGEVVILPMMYLALSYDHRIIDGKESVSFLVKVKEMLEQPEKMLFGAKDPAEVLLGL